MRQIFPLLNEAPCPLFIETLLSAPTQDPAPALIQEPELTPT